MEARQSLNHLRIAISPKMTWEYFQLLESNYLKMIEPQEIKAPAPQPNPAVDLASNEAKNILQNILTAAKRSAYGR